MKSKENPLIKRMKNRVAQNLGVKPIELDLCGWEKEDIIEMHSKLFGR